MISENDWKCFCEEWGGTETKGIYATIEDISDSENILNGNSSETPTCGEQLNDNVNNDSARQLVIKTCPEVIQYSAIICLPFQTLRLSFSPVK